MRIDLAKNVFQLHGVDASGQVAYKKKPLALSYLSLYQELPMPHFVPICQNSHD